MKRDRNLKRNESNFTELQQKEKWHSIAQEANPIQWSVKYIVFTKRQHLGELLEIKTELKKITESDERKKND